MISLLDRVVVSSRANILVYLILIYAVGTSIIGLSERVLLGVTGQTPGFLNRTASETTLVAVFTNEPVLDLFGCANLLAFILKDSEARRTS
jgi:hypothetical protein